MDRYRCHDGATLVKISDVYLLVADKESRKNLKYITRVNELGAFIWSGISSGSSMDEIISSILSEYDIDDRDKLKKDVRFFIDCLVENKLLIRIQEPVYKAEPGVILTSVCGHNYLVSPDNSIEINDSAAFCWKHLEAGITKDLLIKNVEEAYDISNDDGLEYDIQKLLGELYKRDLIRRTIDDQV